MQSGDIKKLRQSASLVVTKNSPDCHTILMLNRKPHMSFSNALVFPGGVCELKDQTYCKHTNFQEYAKLTALRETFEQTHLLLLPSSVTPNETNKIIQKMKNIHKQTYSQVIGNIWEGQYHQLRPIARFVTPLIPKMSRYDCIFYIHSQTVKIYNCGKHDSLLQIDIQNQECSKYYWSEPSAFIKMAEKKQIFFPPPQNIILQSLMQLGYGNMLHYSNLISQSIIIQPLLGQFNNKKQFILPGDMEYQLDYYLSNEPDSRSGKLVTQIFRKLHSKRQINCKRRVLLQNQPNLKVCLTNFNTQKTIMQYISTLPTASL